MKWFVYRQNNSGGHWVGPKIIFVQAFDYSQANKIAEKNGAYFGDPLPGDCIECCGYRWVEADIDSSAEEVPEYWGTPPQSGDVVVYLKEPNDILKENL